VRNERHELPPADEVWFAENGYTRVPRPTSLDPETEAKFNALVLSLEKRDGRPLNGPGRRTCARAYRENPDGFERLCAIALQKASRSRRGLLIFMCESGEHRFRLPPGEGQAA
jgi:hypothetical protein